MTNRLRESFLGNIYYRIVQHRLLPLVQRSGMSPNQVTLVGLILAALVPLGFYLHATLGLLFLSASGAADSLDGLLARRQACCSPFGAFLDSSLDRLSDFFYLVGFWTFFWGRPDYLMASLMVFSSQLLTFLVSYVKARAETLGVACDVGLMERGLRVVYLITWALALALFTGQRPLVLWGGLLVYTALTLVTVLQRIQFVRGHLQVKAPTCQRTTVPRTPQ